MALIRRTSASKPFASGKMQFDLSFLPPKHAIDAMYVVVGGEFNVPAAGVTSDQQTRLLDGIECERRLRSSGLGLSVQDWLVLGKDQQRPAQIAGPNANAAMELYWPIGFRDLRGIEATDSPPATDFYLGKTLDVYWAKPADLVAALAVNAGTECYLEVHLHPLSLGKTSTSVVTNYVEFIGKETKLPAGQYLDIFIVKNDGAAITAAELGNVKLTADGAVNFLEREKLNTLTRSFNRWIAQGAQVQGATDGVEGESLDLGSAPFAVILHPVKPFKGTKLPTAYDQLMLTIDGTLAAGSARVFYRLLELRTPEKAEAGARKVWGGIIDVEGVAAKTASKNGVDEKQRGFLSGIASRALGKIRGR